MSWKLSRTVLRGETESNLGLLLDAKVGPKEKQPYSFGLTDDSLFAFAGLWERWRDPGGGLVETCTVLTTEPNGLVAPIHNRMPVILKPDDYDLWLDPGVVVPTRVADCLRPFDARLMRKYPVSTRLNCTENDDAACAQEIPLLPAAQMLF